MPTHTSPDISSENKSTSRCPRCGYDVRGVIDTWSDSCPLLGTCSECGLEYQWSQVLHPEKYEPLWCVEFLGAGPMWRSAIKTYRRSFLPWRFWQELKMEHDVRWRRLLAYVLLLLTPLLLCYVIEQTTVAVQVRRLSQQQLIRQQQTAIWGASLLQDQIDDLEALKSPPSQEIANLQAQMITFNSMAQNPGSINITLAEAIVEAVFFPLRSISEGIIMSPWGNQAYPAPINLHIIIMTGQNPVISFPRMLRMQAPQAIIIFLLQAAILPGIALAFLLLPTSRHIAKVRWGHIFRIMLYSFFIPFNVFYLLVALFGTGMIVVSLEPICFWLGRSLFLYGSWIALIVWWAMAIGHYLKMPHGWMIAILFSLMVVLLVPAVFVLFLYALSG